MTENSGRQTGRRDFLKITWAMLAGLAALESGALTLAYLQPRLAEGQFGGIINAGPIENFPNNSVTHLTNGRFYIARMEDGGMLAIYHRCTHLGCTVPWDANQNKFICPCHSSEFDLSGDVLNPPAPRPLDTFALEIVEGQVMVDTSKPIQRSYSDLVEVVYP
ncbi:MAG TPA: Rieske 2Fe-2S domain-containing protein [Anaerolineales bacterium]|nr:Rieske 2Fe-2S domain-containing protein [Anaerolineales bacterium]